MAEFEVNGIRYKSGRMGAITQFHVARRLAPILGALKADGSGEALTLDKLLGPMTEALSSMSDADTEYVLFNVLAKVEREGAPNQWAPIWNRTVQRPMFEDIDNLPALLQIVQGALKDSFSSFFPGAPQ